MAAEDRIAALEATGLMQQEFIPELEVMVRAIAEVEAGGMRAVDEVQAGSVRAATLVQAQRAEPSTVVEAAEDGLVFNKTSCPLVWFSTHWNCWQLSFNYDKSKTSSNLKRVLFSSFDSKEAGAISKDDVKVTYCASERMQKMQTSSTVQESRWTAYTLMTIFIHCN